MSQPNPHPALTHLDIKTHNLHILETRLRAQQDKLQVTELMVQGVEHRISVVKDQTTRLSSGARDRGVIGREDAPVKRLIHPVLPTFGLRVKQLGVGGASIGRRVVQGGNQAQGGREGVLGVDVKGSGSRRGGACDGEGGAG